MNEEQTGKLLRKALAAQSESIATDFEASFAAAETRYDRSVRRYRALAGVAATAALVAIAYGLWSPRQGDWPADYLDEQALLGTTAWTAPSDVLLPHYEYDIYRDLPVLIDLTDLEEGSLL